MYCIVEYSRMPRKSRRDPDQGYERYGPIRAIWAFPPPPPPTFWVVSPPLGRKDLSGPIDARTW